MTDTRDSTAKAQFDAAKLNSEVGRAAAEAIRSRPRCGVRDGILTLANEAAQAFYNSPAPTIGALADKLESYWGEVLFADHERAKHKRILLGDLRRIERVRAGVEEPEASGGTDPLGIARDWSEALIDHAPPSDHMNLLALRAPDLNGVLQKMELLSSTGRDDDRVPAAMLDELRSFVSSRAA